MSATPLSCPLQQKGWILARARLPAAGFHRALQSDRPLPQHLLPLAIFRISRKVIQKPGNSPSVVNLPRDQHLPHLRPLQTVAQLWRHLRRSHRTHDAARAAFPMSVRPAIRPDLCLFPLLRMLTDLPGLQARFSCWAVSRRRSCSWAAEPGRTAGVYRFDTSVDPESAAR